MDDKQIIISFGLVLKQIRESNGFTQEKLAFEIQSHPTHISRLENGHKQPTLTTIFKLATVLNIDPVELIRLVKSKLT